MRAAVDVAHPGLTRYFQGDRLEQHRIDQGVWESDRGTVAARRGSAAAIRHRTNSSAAGSSDHSGEQHRNGLWGIVPAAGSRLCVPPHRPRDGRAYGNTCRTAVNLHREELMKLYQRALATAIAMLLAESASAALLSIAQYPLFLTHRT